MEFNQIFIYIIFNLLVEQNKQLLKIIADEQNLDYEKLVVKYVPSRCSFNKRMKTYKSPSSSDEYV
jgi:hypothetical protein